MARPIPMRKLARVDYDLDRLGRHGDRAAQAGTQLDFSVSVNPLGPPAAGLAWRQADPMKLLSRYPDPDCRALCEHLARRHGVSPTQVVVGNGSNDLIYAAARALRPGHVAIVEPTYTDYLRASLLAGASVSHWLPEDERFQPGPFDPGPAELVWLANPNNPTGWLWPPGALAEWIGRTLVAPIFVVDEAFLPFRDDEQAHSLIPMVDRFENVIVLRSLTKVYALAGLRLGYAIASPRLAARLREQIVPWSVNGPAQAAGLASLEDRAYLEATRAWLRDTGPAFLTGLAQCSSRLEVVPSDANFALVRLKGMTAGELAGRLGARGLAVRDASNFVGLSPQHVRFSFRRAEENGRLLRELRWVFQEG